MSSLWRTDAVINQCGAPVRRCGNRRCAKLRKKKRRRGLAASELHLLDELDTFLLHPHRQRVERGAVERAEARKEIFDAVLACFEFI
jgi:hypothetical protein